MKAKPGEKHVIPEMKSEVKPVGKKTVFDMSRNDILKDINRLMGKQPEKVTLPVVPPLVPNKLPSFNALVPPKISDDIFTNDIFNELTQLLNRTVGKVEIELSMGNFIDIYDKNTGKTRQQFIPGVSQISFENIRKNLLILSGNSENFTGKSITNDWYIDQVSSIVESDERNKSFIRRIIHPNEGTVHYERKIRKFDDMISIYQWGCRISKSIEKVLTKEDEPTDFVPTVRRVRNRLSFYTNREVNELHGVRFDLTHVQEIHLNDDGSVDRSYSKYEVEVERMISSKDVDAMTLVFEASLKSILQWMSGSKGKYFLSQPERLYFSNVHNHIFVSENDRRKDQPYHLIMTYPNKPKNIKLNNLLDPRGDWAVTVKLNGTRRFLYLSDKTSYMYLPPDDIWKIPNIDGLNGVIVDGELVENTEDETGGRGGFTYYIFDILFANGDDVRNIPFGQRYALLSELFADKRQALEARKIEIRIKEFDGEGTFYDRVDRVMTTYKSLEKGRADGLVFQPIAIGYHNNFTLKWKPPKDMTIDFLLAPTKNPEEFIPLVNSGKERIQFPGSQLHKFSGIVYAQEGKLNGFEVANRILECSFQPVGKSWGFIPIRFRDDKDVPNNIATAEDVWNDIVSPMRETTIIGQDGIIARRLFNQEKYFMYQSFLTAGDFIVNFGAGRGGDINKHFDMRMRVIDVEPNEDNLKELQRRVKPYEKEFSETWIKAYAQDTEKLVKKVDEFGKGKSLNAITAFFCLNFLSESEETYNGLLRTIETLLPVGGRLVGIVMDGKRTKELLEGERQLQQLKEDEASEFTNPMFRIEQLSKFTDKPVGNKIRIHLTDETSMVHDQVEYLFDFEDFEKRLKTIGFKLVDTYFLDTRPYVSLLPPLSRPFNALNRAFVFQRLTKKGGSQFEKSPQKEKGPQSKSPQEKPKEKSQEKPKNLPKEEKSKSTKGRLSEKEDKPREKPNVSKKTTTPLRPEQDRKWLWNGRDEGLLILGVTSDENEILHALLRLTSEKYFDTPIKDRVKRGDKTREDILDNLSESQYDKTKFAKHVPYSVFEKMFEGTDKLTEKYMPIYMEFFDVNIAMYKGDALNIYGTDKEKTVILAKVETSDGFHYYPVIKRRAFAEANVPENELKKKRYENETREFDNDDEVLNS